MQNHKTATGRFPSLEKVLQAMPAGPSNAYIFSIRLSHLISKLRNLYVLGIISGKLQIGSDFTRLI